MKFLECMRERGMVNSSDERGFLVVHHVTDVNVPFSYLLEEDYTVS